MDELVAKIRGSLGYRMCMLGEKKGGLLFVAVVKICCSSRGIRGTPLLGAR
jgi:hypothetical protein